jgi:hypothetical protein
MSRNQVLGAGVTLIALAAVAAGGIAPAEAQHSNLKQYTFKESRDSRYCEIALVKPTGIEVYNTTGLNSCPAEQWKTMDLEALAKQFGAAKVIKNGPHFWMMDTNTVSLGEEVSFGGLKARYAATLPAGLVGAKGKATPIYEPFPAKKVQKMVYAKGKPVYEIVDPDGNAFILQAHDEQFPVASLAKLGQQMKELPKGWSYRARTPPEDLILDLGAGQTIHTLADEFHQYYTQVPRSK